MPVVPVVPSSCQFLPVLASSCQFCQFLPVLASSCQLCQFWFCRFCRTQTQTPVATRPHAHGHTQDRQHKGNSAAKEDCSALLRRSKRSQSVTGRHKFAREGQFCGHRGLLRCWERDCNPPSLPSPPLLPSFETSPLLTSPSCLNPPPSPSNLPTTFFSLFLEDEGQVRSAPPLPKPLLRSCLTPTSPLFFFFFLFLFFLFPFSVFSFLFCFFFVCFFTGRGRRGKRERGELFHSLIESSSDSTLHQTIKSSEDLRHFDTDSQYHSNVNQISFQNTGSGDESRTSHHTTEMNKTQGCHVVFNTDRKSELCC